MSASRFFSTLLLGFWLFVLTTASHAQGNMGSGGMGGMGGDAGGASDQRLCADFDPQVVPYTNSDGNVSAITPYQYCDGFDGEILMGEGFLKLSTTTRNPAERRVRVNVNSGHCAGGTPAPGNSPMMLDGVDLDAFFGWANNEYGPASCVTGDPFGDGSDGFLPGKLQCLGDLQHRNNLMQLTEADGTVYQAWQMRVSKPGESLKKAADSAFVFEFGGGLGPNQCPSPDGLPVAIRCKDDGDSDTSDCESYELKTFRACVADYDTAKGGNWHQAYTGCEMNTEIEFTRKP